MRDETTNDDDESAPMIARGGYKEAAQRADGGDVDEGVLLRSGSSSTVRGEGDLCDGRQVRAAPSNRWSTPRWVLKAAVAAAFTVAAVDLLSLARKETAAELTVVRIGWQGTGGNDNGTGGREAWLARDGVDRGTHEGGEKKEKEAWLVGGDAGRNASSFSSPYSSLQPPEWDSTACMGSWGLENLQSEVDPAGYIIWVDAREQLGGVPYSLSDGLFVARTLNRTLVEFPAESGQIGHPDSKLGCGAYWDFDRLCGYHRILGLGAFRKMIEDGRLDFDEFVTITPRDKDANPMKAVRSAKDVRKYFAGYESSKVIVMQNQWKSHIRREPMDLIRPIPFYDDVARRLIDEQPGWKDQAYLAVQWRTETSSGNLTVCYCHVRDSVEKIREREGLERGQVYFNTDLVASASNTYRSKKAATRAKVLKMIEEDYPAATNNSVSAFLEQLEDVGMRSIASGVVAASAKILLASTTRSWAMHRGVCQKMHSKFVDLVMEWREIYGPEGTKNTESLFPAFYRMGNSQSCSG